MAVSVAGGHEGGSGIHAQRLFAYGIEEGECVQPVVRDARAPARREDFFPDLVLHVRVLGEQLQDLRHHV